MLASFLASTPLLSESWKLCSHANAAAPQSFVSNRIGDVTYVAFSGVQTVAGLDLGCRSLVAVDNMAAGVFPALQGYGCEAEEAVMVHAGMLCLFLSMIKLTNFQTQVCLIDPCPCVLPFGRILVKELLRYIEVFPSVFLEYIFSLKKKKR